jgi:hypothetical protein
MKSVVGISLGAAAQDFAFTATFLGEKLHVQRLGTDGSTARAVALVRQWDSKADAIGLGVLKDRYRAGSHRFVEKDSAKLKAVAKQALTTIGGRLGDILQEWSVRHAQIQLGNYFNNARVVFLSGMTNYKRSSHRQVPAEAEGWLISVGGTPKEMLLLAQPGVHLPPPAARRRRWPRSLGAQIMGLGAFTKVVGDAGVTVARARQLPITTGNSYSASGALWAAPTPCAAWAWSSSPPKGKVASPRPW